MILLKNTHCLMPKRYEKPFSDYDLVSIRPIAVEQDPAGLGKYKRLRTNPLYYENSLKYCGGSLYRAALGYDLIWNKQNEEDMISALDFLLASYRYKETYFTEEIRATQPVKLHGVKWSRGVPPKDFSFDTQWPITIFSGEGLTARINAIDKPHRVDIERVNGEVFSISLIKYLRFQDTQILRRKDGLKRKTEKHRFTNSKRWGPKLVAGYSSNKPAPQVAPSVFSMRKVDRWEGAL